MGSIGEIWIAPGPEVTRERPVESAVGVELGAARKDVVGQGPVHDAVQRMEDPEESDRGQGDGRCPGQEHEEAEEPLAPEVPNQGVSQEAGSDEHDGLGHEREEDRVPERAPEVWVVPGVEVVPEPDPLAGQSTGGRVSEAEVDREYERRSDEQRDEEDRRRDQERSEEAPLLEDVLPASGGLARARDRRHSQAIVNRESGKSMVNDSRG